MSAVTEQDFDRRWPATRMRMLQSIPPEAKIQRAQRTVREFMAGTGGKAYVAWSGGRDSSVLLHLVRDQYPDTPAVFYDTGLEFPEVRDRALSEPNVVCMKPKMTFVEVVERYGFPIISKKVAQYVHECQTAKAKGRTDSATYRLRMTGINSKGAFSELARLPAKWRSLVDAPFRIGCQCCDKMKKEPAEKYAEETGRCPIIGMRVGDGQQREKTYTTVRGGRCNVFSGESRNIRARALPASRSSSWPLALWTDADVDYYLRTRGVAVAAVYGMGYDRTGCMFCGFGIHIESRKGENRFQRMARTHPAQWRYCMDKLGLREVMRFIGIPVDPVPQQATLSLDGVTQ